MDGCLLPGRANEQGANFESNMCLGKLRSDSCMVCKQTAVLLLALHKLLLTQS